MWSYVPAGSFISSVGDTRVILITSSNSRRENERMCIFPKCHTFFSFNHGLFAMCRYCRKQAFFKTLALVVKKKTNCQRFVSWSFADLSNIQFIYIYLYMFFFGRGFRMGTSSAACMHMSMGYALFFCRLERIAAVGGGVL